MIEKIEIENFRGIEQGGLEDLTGLNVIIGPNNSGKSSILEALWFGTSPQDSAERVAHLAKRRGWCGVGSLSDLFYNDEKRSSNTIIYRNNRSEHHTFRMLNKIRSDTLQELSTIGENIKIFNNGVEIHTEIDKNIKWKILLSLDGQVSQSVRCESPFKENASVFVETESLTQFGILENAFSSAIAKGYEPHLEALLKRIGMDGQKLRILKRGKEFILHTSSDGKAVPVYFSGDGYKRLLYVACILASSTNQLVLLEEPECFQHPRYIRELSQLLWGAVDQGTQIVMSTHSIDLLHQLFFHQNVPLEKSKIFRTQLKHGRLSTRAIEGPRARDRMDELGEDLR